MQNYKLFVCIYIALVEFILKSIGWEYHLAAFYCGIEDISGEHSEVRYHVVRGRDRQKLGFFINRYCC